LPTLEGFEILGELGRGGMGVVYRARQVGLDRLVALKMILAGDFAGDEARRRFLAEAAVVARLQHPGVVQVHAFGTAPGGSPYFALEYLPGGSLDQKLAGTPLPPRAAAELVAAVAAAVQAAHDAGVVHRDLKPANILLTADGTPKVTDFGLAKHGSSNLTGSGAILGTPSYMAPEQAGGGAKEVGPAADVYALGALLYECLTGRPPFTAATPLDTLLLVVSEEPVPPTRLQPRTPYDLETVCLKCLHKSPSQRYASAAELALDLGRFLNGEPVRARRPGLLTYGRFWIRRPERIRDAGVILVLMSLLAIPPALLQAYRFSAWLRNVPGLYGGALVGLLFALGVVVVQGFVGLHLIARRLWAIWAGLVLRLLIEAAYVVNVWLQIGRLRLGAVLERGEGLDWTAQYGSMLELGLVNAIPLLACLVALYAYYCNRATLRAPRSSTPTRVTAVLAVALFAVVAGRYIEQGGRRFRPEIGHDGGTVLLYAVDETKPRAPAYQPADLVDALRRRLGDGRVAVRAVGDTQIEIAIPRTRGHHEASVAQVKELARWRGQLEFRIVANDPDDAQGIAAAKQLLQDPKQKNQLARLAREGGPPPPPEPPKAQARILNGREYPYFQSPKGQFTYSWVELGRKQCRQLGLDDAAQTSADPLRRAKWALCAEARGKGEAVPLADWGGILLYSRPCEDVGLSPEERREKQYEYFVLARDAERDPKTGEPKTISNVVDARESLAQGTRVAVAFRLGARGAERMHELTSRNLPEVRGGAAFRRHLAILLDGKIVSAPSLNSAVRADGQIVGDFTVEEVTQLVRILRAGVLPAMLRGEPSQETSVPPRIW
jgi:hypothetical protein